VNCSRRSGTVGNPGNEEFGPYAVFSKKDKMYFPNLERENTTF
jgi:hypothetical protein